MVLLLFGVLFNDGVGMLLQARAEASLFTYLVHAFVVCHALFGNGLALRGMLVTDVHAHACKELVQEAKVIAFSTFFILFVVYSSYGQQKCSPMQPLKCCSNQLPICTRVCAVIDS